MRRRANHPGQLSIAWTQTVDVPTAPVADAQILVHAVDASEHALPARPVGPATASEPAAEDQTDCAELDRSPLLQVLPWDFAATFPPVLQEALDNGLVADEDAGPEGIAALHHEHGRELLMALSDLDSVREARRKGANPMTGNAPRSQVKREELTAELDREIGRLERWSETLLGTYEEVFGPEAAEAFGHCIRARHANIEIMAMPLPRACSEPDLQVAGPLMASGVEPVAAMPPSPALPDRATRSTVRAPRPPRPLPNPKPLRQAVKAGAFGLDERRHLVDPCPDEVHEITAHHAEVLMERIRAFRRAGMPAGQVVTAEPVRQAVEKYADDFGPQAAAALLAYCRRQVDREYAPGMR